MTTRCLIVDDEPLAIDVIAGYLAEFEDFEVISTCCDAMHALAVLKEEKIDLMFLDIQMPNIKGTDFLRTLSNPPTVIITTAFREYALEGFELDVLDYLLKPISFERFIKAIDRYLEQGSSMSDDRGTSSSTGFINIKSDRKTVRLDTREIICIEAMKDYANIITTDGSVMTNMTMQRLESLLPDKKFLRIHRSYIVAVAAVTAFNSETVELGDKELSIGRHYRKNVLNVLNISGGHPAE